MSNNNNEEIYASDSTIAFSLEPYCEMAHINFVFGPKRSEYEIEVPIEALNKEIYRNGFKINPYVSTDQNCSGFEMQVELPEAQIPWSDAIRQFEKYLKPPHKNNKRITNSPIIPVNLSPSFWLPLYYLTNRFDMRNFRNKLMKINFTTNYCIEILSQIHEMANLRIHFPEIENIIFKSLSSNLDSLPSQSFGGIEMAPVILKILEANPNSINPPSIVEWLIRVFNSFAEHPNQQQVNHEIIQKIINFLNVNETKIAFIIWCYNIIFGKKEEDSILEQYLSNFELKDYYKLLINIPFQNLFWLLNHLNLDLNKTQIMHLIIQWIKKTSADKFYNSSYQEKRLSESRVLFNFAVKNNLLNINQLDGVELCTLLPFAFLFQSQNTDMIERFIYKIKMENYNSAINCKNSNFSLLSWNVLISTFSLIHNPIPNERKSSLVERMRISYKAIDSIFFHWIYSNRNAVRNNMRLVNMNVINEYFRLPSTDVNIVRSPLRRLMIYDVLTCLPRNRELEGAKRSLFDKSLKQPFNFEECLIRLLGKASLNLTVETLEFIKHQIKRSVHKMALFCSILEKFYIPLPTPRLIDPVNEYTVKTCINIMIRSINKQNPSNDYVRLLVQYIKPMISLSFNFLTVNEIISVAQIIPFYDFIIDDFFTSAFEDYILLYAFSSSSFQPILLQNRPMHMNINWKAINSPEFQKELNFINWSHISSRSLIRITSYIFNFLQDVVFQFDDEDEIISNLRFINNKQVVQTVYNSWKSYRPPRTNYKNLAAIPPKSIRLYLIDFDYESIDQNENDSLIKKQFLQMGYENVTIIFVSEGTVYLDSDEAVIVYKNTRSSERKVEPTKIKEFIHSLFASKNVPIVINAPLLAQIYQECPDEWEAYIGNDNMFNCSFMFQKMETPMNTTNITATNNGNNIAYSAGSVNSNNYNNYGGNYNNNNNYNGNNNNYGNNYNYNYNNNSYNSNSYGNNNYNGNNYNSNNYSNNNYNSNNYNNNNYSNNNYNSNNYNYNNYNSNNYNYNNNNYNYNNYNNNNYNNYNNSNYGNYNNYNSNYNYNQNSSNYNPNSNNHNYDYYNHPQNNYNPNFNNQNRHIQIDPVERIHWKEPSPTMLPLKMDLIQFPMPKNTDDFFDSIPFYPCYENQFLRARIEWKNGHIFACSLANIPLSIFNFSLDFNLNKANDDDNPLSDFYRHAASKQSSQCLLSLICQSYAETTPILNCVQSNDDANAEK